MHLFNKGSRVDPLKVIIIGAGEVGFHIAQRLSQENKQVVVIDKNAAALRRIAEYMDVQTLHGSGSSPIILDQAGVGDADIVLAVTDSDEINIIASFFANILAPESLKLARIRNEEYTLYRDALSKDALNISMVINPEVEVVKTIDRLITVPGAVDFNEFADGRIKMLGLRVGGNEFIGLTLAKLREKLSRIDFIIAAIVREDDKLIIPTGDDVLREGDVIYLVCEQEHLEALLKAFGSKARPVGNVLIIGGGNIGFRLALLCEKKGYHTKLMDRDPEVCATLAERLNKTIVLNGDGTDQDFLKEENVDGMDVVISLTGDEETNILSSLLAKSLGARKTVTRINKFAYMPLVRAIGIEHSVSPRLSAINSILHYVRRGKVLSSVSIKGEEAEAMEAIAQEKSDIVGKPLMDLNLPKGVLILSIIRGKNVIVPGGDTVIQPQDRIIIFATRKAISQVEQRLTVKFKYY
jgi:trk system potassium uptake protein TrkA